MQARTNYREVYQSWEGFEKLARTLLPMQEQTQAGAPEIPSPALLVSSSQIGSGVEDQSSLKRWDRLELEQAVEGLREIGSTPEVIQTRFCKQMLDLADGVEVPQFELQRDYMAFMVMSLIVRDAYRATYTRKQQNPQS